MSPPRESDLVRFARVPVKPGWLTPAQETMLRAYTRVLEGADAE